MSVTNFLSNHLSLSQYTLLNHTAQYTLSSQERQQCLSCFSVRAYATRHRELADFCGAGEALLANSHRKIAKLEDIPLLGLCVALIDLIVGKVCALFARMVHRSTSETMPSIIPTAPINPMLEEARKIANLSLYFGATRIADVPPEVLRTAGYTLLTNTIDEEANYRGIAIITHEGMTSLCFFFGDGPHCFEENELNTLMENAVTAIVEEEISLDRIIGRIPGATPDESSSVMAKCKLWGRHYN